MVIFEYNFDLFIIPSFWWVIVICSLFFLLFTFAFGCDFFSPQLVLCSRFMLAGYQGHILGQQKFLFGLSEIFQPLPLACQWIQVAGRLLTMQTFFPILVLRIKQKFKKVLTVRPRHSILCCKYVILILPLRTFPSSWRDFLCSFSEICSQWYSAPPFYCGKVYIIQNIQF